MPDYTTLGISYPLPADQIKDAATAAKLADDLKRLAVSANQAILVEGGRAEAAATAASNAYADDRDAAYRVVDRALWRSEDQAIKTEAATDATGKANTAKTEAISAASSDATTKANTAKSESIADATTKYGGLPAEVTAIKARELPDRGRLVPADYPGGVDTVAVKGSYAVWTTSDATALGLPFAKDGRLDVFTYGNVVKHRWTVITTGGPLQFDHQKEGESWIGPWSQPRNLEYEARELPDRGRLLPADYPGGIGTVTLKGRHAVWTSADATSLGLPFPAAGSVNVFKFGNVTMYQQKATTSEGTLTYENWKTDTGALGEWSQPRNTGYESRLTTLEASTSRVAAVALSTGDGGGLDTATSRNFRYPIKLAATVRRFRVHVMNANPRYGNRYSGALSFTGLGIAKHAGAVDPALEGQFDGAVTTIDQGFTTNNLGYEYVSPWVENDPIKGYTEYLLTGGYTCAAQNNFAGVGGGWMTANANDWNVAAPTGMTVSQKLPLYVWLEAEVDSDVPVGAWFGDSLASGVSARLGVFDSAPNRHALANGYIPTLYTNSGIKMSDHTDPAHFRWTRYDTASGLSKPDFLVWEMGSNDVFGSGVTLETLKTTFDTVWKIAAVKLSPNIALMTVLPRFDAEHTQEAVRKEWNEHLLTTLPGRAVVAVDTAGPLTNPDGSTLNAKYIAAPGDIHLSAAGYARFIKDLPAMN